MTVQPRQTRALSKRANDYVTAKQCAEIVNAAMREALVQYHVSQESRRWSVRVRVAALAVWTWATGRVRR